MAISDRWNIELVNLKRQYPWLTNRLIANALDVSESRVNSWTRVSGGRMDHAFCELLEMKLRGGALTKPVR